MTQNEILAYKAGWADKEYGRANRATQFYNDDGGACRAAYQNGWNDFVVQTAPKRIYRAY